LVAIMIVMTGAIVVVRAGTARMAVHQRFAGAVIRGEQEARGGGRDNAADQHALSSESLQHGSLRL